jgi:hypothetical protein
MAHRPHLTTHHLVTRRPSQLTILCPNHRISSPLQAMDHQNLPTMRLQQAMGHLSQLITRPLQAMVHQNLPIMRLLLAMGHQNLPTMRLLPAMGHLSQLITRLHQEAMSPKLTAMAPLQNLSTHPPSRPIMAFHPME